MIPGRTDVFRKQPPARAHFLGRYGRFLGRNTRTLGRNARTFPRNTNRLYDAKHKSEGPEEDN